MGNLTINYKWWFSIVMLVYQRVTHFFKEPRNWSMVEPPPVKKLESHGGSSWLRIKKEQTASKSSVAYHWYPHYSPLHPYYIPITSLLHPCYIPITSLLHPCHNPTLRSFFHPWYSHCITGTLQQFQIIQWAYPIYNYPFWIYINEPLALYKLKHITMGNLTQE